MALSQLITFEHHRTLLAKCIIEEISYALGGKKKGFLTSILTLVFKKPALHMAGIVANFYNLVITESTQIAAMHTLPRFDISVNCTTKNQIQATGPLLILANHPGGLDSVGILSCLPRHDVKALVSDVRLLRETDYLNKHMIFVDFKAIDGMAALRQAIDHLRSGGMLLLFPRGEVEPDPSCMPGAIESIEKWSPSIEILLQKVPETCVQFVTTSGAILPKLMTHPIVKIRRKIEARQKLAEFIQVIGSAVLPGKSRVAMNITLSNPVKLDEFTDNPLLPQVIQLAKQHMQDHIRILKYNVI
jgi:hypothetical protein